jgi:hypothetical protein
VCSFTTLGNYSRALDNGIKRFALSEKWVLISDSDLTNDQAFTGILAIIAIA